MPAAIRAAVIAAAVTLTALFATPAGTAPAWAPAATAAIHPGVQTVTAGGQCTANFIYTNGADVLIGQAAHCASTGGPSDLDGCTTGSQPLGTTVDVGGASQPGILVYSSWLAMQAAGESDPNVCNSNDLALVRIAPADVAKVNPSIPHWGGPMGINTTGAPLGSTVYSYGNSSLRLGITLLSPKTGISQGDYNDGWAHAVNTVTPGIPGDSGSAYVDSAGRALGTLTALAAGTPFLVWDQIGDIGREVAYARAHGFGGLVLENGTVPFNGAQLPLDLAHPLG
jgi:hypothetical protein